MNRMRWAAVSLGFALAALPSACGGSASRQPAVETGGGDAGGEAGTSGSVSEGSGGAGGGMAGGGSGAAPNGGALGGATPAGGSHAAGSSGASAGGQPSLALPQGCEARTSTETETSCSLGAFCSVQSQVVSCAELPSGRFQCSCEVFNRDRTFEVEGVRGLQACAVAVGACGADESEMAKEACEPLSEDGTPDSCHINLRCSREIEVPFAPGARAWWVRGGDADCYQSNTGPALECGCTYRGVHEWHDILTDSAKDACRPLVDFCMTGESPSYDGAEQCVMVHEASGSEGCQRGDGCGSTMTLAPGVALVKLTTRYSNCDPGAEGGSDCYCDTLNSGHFEFHAADPPDAAGCAVASEACKEDAEIVPMGALSCDSNASSELGDMWCDAVVPCSQPASVAGKSVVAKGKMGVRCARSAADAPWQCSCGLGDATVRVKLDTVSTTTAEACNRAVPSCLEHVDAELGPQGDFIFPPLPLSP